MIAYWLDAEVTGRGVIGFSVLLSCLEVTLL